LASPASSVLYGPKPALDADFEIELGYLRQGPCLAIFHTSLREYAMSTKVSADGQFIEREREAWQLYLLARLLAEEISARIPEHANDELCAVAALLRDRLRAHQEALVRMGLDRTKPKAA
jgi:hypothetical protein